MKKLFGYADEYARQSSWKDFALVKFCLCAIGILIGIALPKRAHKSATVIASTVFTATYIPLMMKFLGIVKKEKRRQCS